MNGLDQQHIEHINTFLLENYHLYYVDIRTELVDHIASEIEEQMNIGRAYNESFVTVFASWDKSALLSFTMSS